MANRKYSEPEARARIEAYCAYRERSHFEVKEKLYDWGLHRNEVEGLLAHLVTTNFLNEERFAQAYVSGKFRIKRWGRRKILEGLKANRISEYCVRKGMQEISEEEYEETIKSLAQQKMKLTKGGSRFERNGKVAQYIIRKGFEPDLVWPIITALK